MSRNFEKLGEIKSRQWLMIFAGLLLGLFCSFGMWLAMEVRILGWFAGLLLVYYSASWPAKGDVLIRHREQVATGLIVLIAVSMLYELRGSSSTYSFLDAAIARAAAIGFVSLASQILAGALRLEISSLKHGVLLFQQHNVGVLVEEGGPIFARSGFSIDEQSNEKLLVDGEIDVEVGGTVAVKTKFFMETEIDRELWNKEGQIHWLLGPDAATEGFLKAGEVEIRTIASEGFESGDVKGFKSAADGSMSLWIKWRLMAQDPRENAALVRELGWNLVESNGHVSMKNGIAFFKRYAEDLEAILNRVLEFEENPASRTEIPTTSAKARIHKLALLVEPESETERKFGRKFVGRCFGISDVIAPPEVEEAFTQGTQIKELDKQFEGIPDARLKLLLAAGGHLSLTVQQFEGLENSNAVVVTDPSGAKAVVAARANKGGQPGGGRPPADHGHGGGHK